MTPTAKYIQIPLNSSHGGPEDNVRLLLTTRPVRSVAPCRGHSISFERFLRLVIQPGSKEIDWTTSL